MIKKLIQFIDGNIKDEKDLEILENVINYYIKESNSNYVKLKFKRLGECELNYLVKKYNKVFYKCYISKEDDFTTFNLFKISPTCELTNTIHNLILNSPNVIGNNFKIHLNCPKNYFLSLPYNLKQKEENVFELGGNDFEIVFI